MATTPNHHDADLVLKLYELRRETVMRQNRSLILKELWPRNATEMTDVIKADHPLNVAYRQVTTYWEMAYAFCKHGALSPDLLLDSSAEGMFLYARIEPYLAEVRTVGNPRNFRATEWIATQTAIGKDIMEFQRKRVAKLLAARPA